MLSFSDRSLFESVRTHTRTHTHTHKISGIQFKPNIVLVYANFICNFDSKDLRINYNISYYNYNISR